MTTNVTIDAHTDTGVSHVLVQVVADGEVVETYELKDGESQTLYAYDNRVITVKEIEEVANGISTTRA